MNQISSPNKLKEAVKIVGLCILASVTYGILHDQITARVYLPYFTEWHPHVIDSQDPTAVGLVWGIIATWWVGLIISVPLAFAALSGREPITPFAKIRKSVLLLLAIMGLCAAAAGTAACALDLQVPDVIAIRGIRVPPPDEVRRFTAVWIAHNVSYLVGFVGGIGLCLLTYHGRRKRHVQPDLA